MQIECRQRHVARVLLLDDMGTLWPVGRFYVLAAVFVLVGIVRPLWSSLSAAVVPAALPLVWIVWGVVEPDRSRGLSAQWYASVGAIYGSVAVSACAVGIVTGRGCATWRRQQVG
jgi:hypothetical protein